MNHSFFRLDCGNRSRIYDTYSTVGALKRFPYFGSDSMIIDLRTQLHATAEPEADACGSSPEAYASAMACVDVAVVVGWRADRLGVDTPPETIASFVNEDPVHRAGFAGVDPLADSAMDDLHRTVELGLSGVSICPADQGCRPTHDRCLQTLEWCAANHLPVLSANPQITDRRSVMEFARPSIWDQVVRDLPTLTLILGDLGAGWVDEAMLLLARHERVFAEISGAAANPWSFYNMLQRSIELRIPDKLLFGSGFPRQTPETVIERMYSINSIRQGSSLPTAPRELLRSIVERDTFRTLDIDHLASRSTVTAPPVVHVNANADGGLVSLNAPAAI